MKQSHFLRETSFSTACSQILQTVTYSANTLSELITGQRR